MAYLKDIKLDDGNMARRIEFDDDCGHLELEGLIKALNGGYRVKDMLNEILYSSINGMEMCQMLLEMEDGTELYIDDWYDYISIPYVLSDALYNPYNETIIIDEEVKSNAEYVYKQYSIMQALAYQMIQIYENKDDVY